MASGPSRRYNANTLIPVCLIAVSFLLSIPQVWISLYVPFSNYEDPDNDSWNNANQHATIRKNNYTAAFLPLPKLSKHDSFGACLMVKGDNDLLYEWLAYHYTVLPLRHIFVASDVDNAEHPGTVLERWKRANTNLEYWTRNASEFIHRHGHEYGPVNSTVDVHHAFIHRQRAFITTCSEFLKSKGMKWVTYIDSDEFIVMNRLTQNETLDNTLSSSIRSSLPNEKSNATVLDAMRKSKGYIRNCYTMPRVLYGALENVTCPKSPTPDDLKTKGFHHQSYDKMSTLRFHLHAEKGDFTKSKYGKVFMDVSSLPNTTIAKEPANIHRPYKSECRYPVVPFPKALFYLNHYLGSWQRYSSREDGRRNKAEWEKRAFLTSAHSCEYNVFRWFDRFVDLVGIERAKYLLGEGGDF